MRNIDAEVAAEPVSIDGGMVEATLSIGVVLARPDESVDALLARADDAMYQAKEAGRNRVVAIPDADPASPAVGHPA